MVHGIFERFTKTSVLTACCLATVLFGCGVGGPGPLEFTVTFYDAGGLEPGQLVIYNGVRIGEVLAVELDESERVRVLVSVEPEHRSRVYRESEFLVEKPGGIMDISGERQLTMNNISKSDRTPMENGDIVVGADGWVDQAYNRARAAGGWVYGWGEDLYEKAVEWQDSSEGRAFKEKLSDFVEGAAEAGEEGWQSFRDEHYPRLRESALAFKERLEEEGLTEEAKELWEQFTALEDRDEEH